MKRNEKNSEIEALLAVIDGRGFMKIFFSFRQFDERRLANMDEHSSRRTFVNKLTYDNNDTTRVLSNVFSF